MESLERQCSTKLFPKPGESGENPLMPFFALLLGLECCSRNCKVLLVVLPSGPGKHGGAGVSTVTLEKEGCGMDPDSGLTVWSVHALPVSV